MLLNELQKQTRLNERQAEQADATREAVLAKRRRQLEAGMAAMYSNPSDFRTSTMKSAPG